VEGLPLCKDYNCNILNTDCAAAEKANEKNLGCCTYASAKPEDQNKTICEKIVKDLGPAECAKKTGGKWDANCKQPECSASATESTTVVAPKLEIPEFKTIKFSDNIPLTDGADGKKYINIPWIGEFVQYVYNYAISIAGILAVVMIMVGGIMWVVSAGDSGRITTAKTYITSAVVGLIILFTSYTILKNVNPALVIFTPIQIESIENIPIEISTDEALATSDSSNFQASTPSGNTTQIIVSGYSGKPIILDKSVADSAKSAMEKSIASGYKITATSSKRPAPAKGISWHTSGLAIDINPSQNPCPCCYQKGKTYKDCPDNWKPGVNGALTKAVVDAFKSEGWCWGGDWCNFKDYMHFSKPSNSGSKECGGNKNGCPYQW